MEIRGQKRARESKRIQDMEYERIKKELLDSGEGGVYYDAGWGDNGPGAYTINEWDGEEISLATFKRLRKEGILGGNRLMTHKARKWHPVLKPGEKDASKLGDKFFRQAPFKTETQLKREDPSEDVYGTLEVKSTSNGKVTWQKVDPAHFPKGRVLCSNNITAVPVDDDSSHTMSHVWIATLVNRRGEIVGVDPQEADGYFTFAHDGLIISFVEYWAPVPVQWSPRHCLKLIQTQPLYQSKVLIKRF